MEKSIWKHFLNIGSGTLVSMIISMITTPVITRLVSPENYGQFSVFSMYAGIAVMVLCLGLDQALVRYYYHSEKIAYKRFLVFSCWRAPAILAGISAAVFLIILKFGWLRFEFDEMISFLLVIYTVVIIMNRFAMLVLRVNYDSKCFALCNVMQKILFLILGLFLICTLHMEHFGALVLALLLSTVFPTLAGIYYKREEWNFRKERSAEQIQVREIYRYGAPFILSLGLTTLFQAADKMALNYYCDYSDVGIYSSAMNLVNIFAVIQTSFNMLWAPMSVEHYEKQPQDLLFYKKWNQNITVVMFGVGITLVLFKDLFVFFLGERYREAAQILPFLIFNPIMYTISEVTVSGIVIKKKSNMHVIIALGSCMVNILGNCLLVPVWGCRGAAISTGAAYIVFWALRTFISGRYFKAGYENGKFCVLTAFMIGFAFYNTFFDNYLIIIAGYFGIGALILILYRNTVLDGIKEVRKIVLKRKS